MFFFQIRLGSPERRGGVWSWCCWRLLSSWRLMMTKSHRCRWCCWSIEYWGNWLLLLLIADLLLRLMMMWWTKWNFYFPNHFLDWRLLNARNGGVIKCTVPLLSNDDDDGGLKLLSWMATLLPPPQVTTVVNSPGEISQSAPVALRCCLAAATAAVVVPPGILNLSSPCWKLLCSLLPILWTIYLFINLNSWWNYNLVLSEMTCDVLRLPHAVVTPEKIPVVILVLVPRLRGLFPWPRPRWLLDWPRPRLVRHLTQWWHSVLRTSVFKKQKNRVTRNPFLFFFK